MFFQQVLSNQFFLLFITIFAGILFGKIRIGRFAFGASGILILGLFIGWAVQKYIVLPASLLTDPPSYATAFLAREVVSKEIFTFSLILFIAAVGLMAASDLGSILRKHGLALVALGFIVPFSGAVLSLLAERLSGNIDPWISSGVFTGALTSSPGLAGALEHASRAGRDAQAAVGYGYALGYSPGVIMVILAIQFVPLLFRINVEIERQEFYAMLPEDTNKKQASAGTTGLFSFALVCALGLGFGSVTIRMGSVGTVSLGVTGGVLLSALILGAVGNIGPLSFREPVSVLSARKELGLALFLAVVGLKYGYITLHTIGDEGFIIMGYAFIIATGSILLGFIVGRYLFRLNWFILSGALCGAMTSTPGLGAAVDSTKSELVAVGYGATYPFALIGMVIFTVLLQHIPL